MSHTLVEAPGLGARAAVGATEATIASTWLIAAQRPADEDLLDWPPDMFAFTDVILDRAEAYRFVVSPPPGRVWPPTDAPTWREEVHTAARRWSEWSEGRVGIPPELVVREWLIVRDALSTPLGDLASGRAWRVCEALVTLHSIADEACAAVATAANGRDAGIIMRARASELLARTGTIARIDPALLRVVPKYRTPSGGIKPRSISRYISRTGPAVSLTVDKVTTGRGDSDSGELNVLLLPWPLRIAAEDFRPVPGSIQERDVEPFGYFQFQPSEPFDVSLVDRLLTSASGHVDRVDLVVLPESAVPREELARLEAVLSRHGVTMLVVGLRDTPGEVNFSASNWVHFGVGLGSRWWHYRQDKHHRWSLDRSQIEQYRLEGVLDPRVRWWEEIEIGRRSLQIIERDDGPTIASLVCEDLAHIDEVIDLIRAVGPTLVVALLLDGPQLGSRWTARYASVLADDPGSAVLTLTSYGMVTNASGRRLLPTSVVALWKDNARGLREIQLDADAQGILLRLARRPAIRRAADGRLPARSASDLRLSEVTQLVPAATVPSRPVAQRSDQSSLSPADLTVLVSWSEAVAEARAISPAAVGTVLADARAGASWRTDFGLPQPATALSGALDALAGDSRAGR